MSNDPTGPTPVPLIKDTVGINHRSWSARLGDMIERFRKPGESKASVAVPEKLASAAQGASFKKIKHGPGKFVLIGGALLLVAAGAWKLLSYDVGRNSPDNNTESNTQKAPLRKETDEEHRIAVAASPIILSYRRELEVNGAKFFTGMAEPEQKAKLLDKAVNLNSRKIRDAIFLPRDEKCIVKFDIKARDTNDGTLPVRLDIDPQAGKITTTINNAKKYDYLIPVVQKDKLLKAVTPAAKNAFNTIAPAQGLETVPSLAQLTAPVEAKQLPAAPAVRQIARRRF